MGLISLIVLLKGSSFYNKVVISEFTIPGFIGNLTLLARPLPFGKGLNFFRNLYRMLVKVFLLSDFNFFKEIKDIDFRH